MNDEANVNEPDDIVERYTDNRNYVKNLILESDLMMTTEEAELFPKHQIDFVVNDNQTGINSSVLITEMHLPKDDSGQDEKRVLGSLMETKEESFLDTDPINRSIGMMEDDANNPSEGIEQPERELSMEEELSDGSPENNDDLWDTDLEPDGEFKSTKDHSTTAAYIEHCSKLDVVPAKYYLQNMHKSVLSMKYHGLGPHGTKALAKSLESNIAVDVLDLSGNWMHSNGAAAVGRMLEENNFITKMILAGNSIGDQGVASLGKSLRVNTGIRHLDISDNNITDQGCVHVKDIMETNRYLLELNLSKNNIDSNGACLLGEGISSNDILESLDLSWNKIRGKGAVAVANGIKENIRLKWCNLSYNGFAHDAGRELADMIKDNSALVSLNIEANRIDGETAALIGRALTSNENIEELKLGHNTMDTSGVLKLISSINSYETSHLKILHLTDIPVDFETIKVIELIQKKRPDFKCFYGLEMMVGNTTDDLKKRASNIMNPILLLKQHILIKDKRLIDILLNVDSDRKLYVTVEQFGQALQEMGVPFKRGQLEELRSRLDKFGNGTIYYGDFVPAESLTLAVDAQTEPDDVI